MEILHTYCYVSVKKIYNILQHLQFVDIFRIWCAGMATTVQMQTSTLGAFIRQTTVWQLRMLKVSLDY
jgi:hypothetical protein